MIVVIWISTFLFFWIAYHRFTHGHFTRHLGFYHYILYFVAIYWGALDLYQSRGSVNSLFLMSVFLYPVLSFCGMLWACIIRNRTFYPKVEVFTKPKDVNLVVVAVLFFLAIFGCYIYTLWPNIPIVIALQNSHMDAHVARYLSTKAYRHEIFGLNFLYWLPRILIDYFGIFVIVFFYYKFRHTFKDRFKLALIVLAVFVIGIVANEKYPIVKMYAIFALCFFNKNYFVVSRRAIVSSVSIVTAGITVTGILYILVTAKIEELTNIGFFGVIYKVFVERGWALLSSRGVTGQCVPLYVIYDLIPHKYDFFMGRTFSNPHGILPYEPVALPYLIYESYNLPVSKNLRGADPTVFFGEIYANFGFLISCLSMFLFGAILQIVNDRLSLKIAQKKTSFYVAFFYLMMAYLGDFAIGFSVPYFDERLLFFVGFYFLTRLKL